MDEYVKRIGKKQDTRPGAGRHKKNIFIKVPGVQGGHVPKEEQTGEITPERHNEIVLQIQGERYDMEEKYKEKIKELEQVIHHQNEFRA